MSFYYTKMECIENGVYHTNIYIYIYRYISIYNMHIVNKMAKCTVQKGVLLILISSHSISGTHIPYITM